MLLAFRADIDLHREPGKGWTFRFRTKPLTDATIGKLLSQLLGNFLDPANNPPTGTPPKTRQTLHTEAHHRRLS